MKVSSRKSCEERGAAAVEYLLLFSMIVLVVLGAVSALGGSFGEIFHELAQNLPTR